MLVRTAACGVCRSDLHFVDGVYPHVLPTVPG
ncbi:alcohol dehydrogenase catalytic domain-containing protein, partial [Lacticaseibacillus paracasei]